MPIIQVSIWQKLIHGLEVTGLLCPLLRRTVEGFQNGESEVFQEGLEGYVKCAKIRLHKGCIRIEFCFLSCLTSLGFRAEFRSQG